jgi:hypothetical protein
MLGIDAKELVFPSLDFSTRDLLEVQTLVFPLLRLLAELRDYFGLVFILCCRVRGKGGGKGKSAGKSQKSSMG